MTIEVTKGNKHIFAEAMRLYILANSDAQKRFEKDILDFKERDKTPPKDEKDILMRKVLSVESHERVLYNLKTDAEYAEILWEKIRES